MNRKIVGRRASALTTFVAAVSVMLPALPNPSSAADGASQAADRSRRRITLETVSNPRPELVSGGEVLIRVVLPDHVDGDDLAITRNGDDVTESFAEQPDGSWLGVVEGLDDGRNRIVARMEHHGRYGPPPAKVRVVNHPITGPVFSGPQQLPFYCETEAFGLDPATQPLCSAPTEVSFLYRTTGGQFAPLDDPADRPSDLATTTVNGEVVPYIVRIERGTIDRAVYEIAALYGGVDPDPVGPDSGWNERLAYTFGGGCNAGYHQGAGTGGVVDDLFLSQGYAVASSSLNVLDNNCSPIISAEAAMMVKEHLIETYGPVQHTIGWGGSGGAIQQYDIADSYPGILDGILPSASYPDPLTTLGPVADCRLLRDYFSNTGLDFTLEEERAVAGFATNHVCESWDATFASRITATGSCNPAIPVEARWDPVTNPDGVKCAAIEQVVTQLGRDPDTGFVRSPLDNVGVPYGLQALDDGVITPDQFIDLNTNIGGYDVTGELSPERSRADRRALRISYRDNLVNSGGEGLATTPVIDLRIYLDNVAAGFADIHTAEWSYVMRQRMIERGTVGNQVILEFGPQHSPAALADALDAMERWLTAIDADDGRGSLRSKIVRNRPDDLTDGCYLPDGTRIAEPLSYDGTGTCPDLYPIFANPRLVAGEPLTRDVLKCRLIPLNRVDWPVTFTRTQRAQLAAAFPDGVCDYDRRGVEQRRPRGTWLDYGS